MTEVAIVCGVGGTGKTTTAAAMAVGYALAGERVVVLTIDPARRLADALGLEQLGNRPTRIPLDAPGTLDALMLDRKGTWDEVVRRLSPSPEVAERLLANRYYRAVSTRLTGSHEYMAIEKLHELVSAGSWDRVIVDTPPARHVVDLFDAPDRIMRVFDKSVLSSLMEPGRGLFGLATRRAFTLVQKVAGEGVMEDISEFFGLISGLSGGFRNHAAVVHQVLHAPHTRYFLVANARAPERSDMLAFRELLRARGMELGGFLVNRVAPTMPSVEALIADLPANARATWGPALRGLAETTRDEAARHRKSAADIARVGGAATWVVPDLPGGIRSLPGLAALSRSLPPNPAAIAGS